MRLRLFAAAVLLAAPCVFAADFWQEKDSSQWTPKEVKHLLTKSPWAHGARVDSNAPMKTGNRSSYPSTPRYGTRSGSGRRDGMNTTTGTNQTTRMPSGGMKSLPDVQVRWQSAAPMIDAALQYEDPGARKLAEWSKEFYVIVVSAEPALGKGARTAGEAKVQKAAGRLQAVTTLTPKGKDPRKADRAEAYMSAGGPMLAFLFSRGEALTAADKDVEFATAMGNYSVKAKFNLKDMVRKNKLEL